MLVQEAIKEAINEKGISQNEAARQMGISRSGLNQVLTGRSVITESMALKLETLLGLRAEKILQLQTREALEKLRGEGDEDGVGK